MTGSKLFIVIAALLIVIGCSKKLDEEELEAIIQHSLQLALEGKHKEAIKYVEENTPPKQRGFRYYYLHGLVLQMESPLYNLQKYNADYLKAYELEPDNYHILVSLGQSYNILADWENAVIYLEKAVEIYTQNPNKKSDPYNSLFSAYYSLDEFEKAFIAIERAIEITPDKAWNYLDKGLILSQLEGLEPLIEYYQKAVSMDPENLMFPKYYGNRLIEMGLDDMAIEHFNKFLAIDENYYWAYADLGYIRMVNGDWEGGKEYFDRSYSILHDDPLTLMYLAFYYYFQGNLPKALDFQLDYRLSMEKSVLIYGLKTAEEFEEYFADDKLFQRLKAVVDEMKLATL
ncbi:hypothetical protein S1OALGB6SA_1154 [Olavius algarvensis spirochete endosymbiont]|nr:hypothetical protein S1OALGB6SA_1154 [Olavius algarvensis spirochete endosymbiont]